MVKKVHRKLRLGFIEHRSRTIIDYSRRLKKARVSD
jgi:hypothetical protein